MILIAILFPPLVFFLIGRFFSGIIALILYVIAIALIFTGILAPVSAVIEIALIIWAIVARNNYKTDKKLKKMEQKIMASQIDSNVE